MLKNLIPELFLKSNTNGINRWMNEGDIGRGFSFTKKGPGRKHNYSGIEKKFKDINLIGNEFDLRVKYGRITSAFIKRWDMHWNNSSSVSSSLMKGLVNKFRSLFFKSKGATK